MKAQASEQEKRLRQSKTRCAAPAVLMLIWCSDGTLEESTMDEMQGVFSDMIVPRKKPEGDDAAVTTTEQRVFIPYTSSDQATEKGSALMCVGRVNLTNELGWPSSPLNKALPRCRCHMAWTMWTVCAKTRRKCNGE